MENPIKIDDLGVPPFSETSIYPEQLGALFSLLRYSTLKPRRFHAIGAKLLNLFNLTFFDSKSVSLNTFLSNLGKLLQFLNLAFWGGGGGNSLTFDHNSRFSQQTWVWVVIYVYIYIYIICPAKKIRKMKKKNRPCEYT